jgi:predicted MFS family arabinose efflux permease
VPAPQEPLSRRLTLLLALTSGAAVANLYYVQPLLHRIGHAFGVGDGTAGLLVTATQVGYVAGLALLVPVGDLLERRRLLCVLLALASLAAAACAAAPRFAVLTIALLTLGALSVVAQIVVALASGLAAPAERGRVVGTVMSGLLLGILLARTVSGIVASLAGWRAMFVVAAVVMVALLGLLLRALPLAPPTEVVPYRRALRSVLTLVAQEPVLRLRMALGALGFATFSILWTSLTFLLAGGSYHLSEAAIGLFGLAGAAGASAAPIAGRLADRGYARLVQTVLLGLLLVSWGLLLTGRHTIAPLIAGIIVLDLGVQGAQIGNQHAIYALNAQARSRLTTAYMVAVFAGGIAGSTLSAAAWSTGGWTDVCALGAAFSLGAVVLWLAAAARVRAGVAAATE